MISEVRAICKVTRLADDGRSHVWPDTFGGIPHVGDYVRARDGAELRVCHVTHLIRPSAHLIGAPMIEVELA